MERRNNKNKVDVTVISPHKSPNLSALKTILDVDLPIAALPQVLNTRSNQNPISHILGQKPLTVISSTGDTFN